MDDKGWFCTELLWKFTERNFIHPRYPGMSAPFIDYHHGFQCATDGKAMCITKDAWPVTCPTLAVPNTKATIDEILVAIKQPGIMLDIRKIPEPLFTRSWCDMCLAQGCDECNENGYEMVIELGKSSVWLPYNGDHYLFNTDYLRNMIGCSIKGEYGHVLYSVVHKSKSSDKPMGVFTFDGGTVAIMGISPGVDVNDELAYPKKPGAT